ncbi:MAG: diguanylate cyclase domain-containing protein [Campylobacterota bacterium]
MHSVLQNDVSEYLDMENEDLEISNILNKYNIQLTVNSSFLYDMKDNYKALIEYICELYIENKSIPNDIKEQITHNNDFRAFIYDDVKSRMNKIIIDDSTIMFKQIVLILDLLSFGKNYQVFENYNFYNLDNLSELFREYEDKLLEHISSDENSMFEITFRHYVILIEMLNELCTINSTDLQRKKTIRDIIETISETINITKFKIKLSEEKINILNNILGKLMFFYSHIPFISIKNKSAKYLIDEFTFNLEKISSGYELSKNTNFAGEQKEELYYVVLLNSATTLLSNLIYKLENFYETSEYSDIEIFHEILDLYEDLIEHKTVSQIDDLQNLKNDLLDNYSYIYNSQNNKKLLHFEIIDDFLNEQRFNSSNMQILLYLVLYSNNIQQEKLVKILQTLLELQKFKNDYHEFFKLNLIDIIIIKLSNFKDDTIKNELNKSIIQYIEQNKIASHLMAIYSKIYLSLSLYFSSHYDKSSNEYSKRYYYKYTCINTNKLLNEEFEEINRKILINLGKKSISDLNLENEINLKDCDYIKIGEKAIDNYGSLFDFETKYNINQKLSNIVSEIFTNDGLDNETLNNYIQEFISRDIFHGLVHCTIEGLCEKNCEISDFGFDKIEISLVNNFKLKIAYSKVYKHVFSNIYDENIDYIKQNLVNLIISYIKSIPIYFDSTTKLKNINKLIKDLKLNKNQDNLLFLELYLNNLNEINDKYTYETGDEVFKSFANKVANIIPTIYRLQGPRIGVVVENQKEYKNIINEIKEIVLKVNNKSIVPKLTIAVSWGNSENILKKSEYCLTLASKSSDKYNEFK